MVKQRILNHLARRKGIEVGRFLLIIVFFIPAAILGAVVLAMVLGITIEGIPFASDLLVIIVCSILPGPAM